jgi:hypothetical protein
MYARIFFCGESRPRQCRTPDFPPQTHCVRLALFGNMPKQTPAASSLPPHGRHLGHLALRSSALSRRSNHDKTYRLFPAMKLTTRSSKACWTSLCTYGETCLSEGKPQSLSPTHHYVECQTHTHLHVPHRGRVSRVGWIKIVGPTTHKGMSDLHLIIIPSVTPAHATPNLHVVPCRARHWHYPLPPVLV